MLPELAHWLGLVPLLWVAGWKRDVAYWWLAGALGVSWLADTAAHWVDPWLVSLTYPLLQSAVVGAVLLPRREAWRFAGVLIVTALASAIVHRSPDVLLHTVAWLGVVIMVYPRPALGMLGLSLLVYFGLGWLCWLGYTVYPGWPSWLAYQGSRVAGILLFCRAVTNPLPRLRLA